MRKRNSTLVVTALIVLTLICGRCEAADVLGIAKRLAAQKYKGWTYGSRQSEKQIDCVQFVLAVVQEALAQSLNADARSQILISNLGSPGQKKLAALIEAEDARTKGVQHALVSIGLGSAIDPEDARAGDLVQYWMKREDGTWYGHASVLENVRRSGSTYSAKLYGAHGSTNGIATSRFSLRLNGPDRKVYIVRLKE